MEQLLQRELGCSRVKAVGLSGGGCISEGQSYSTDSGTVFAKINHKSQVLIYKGGGRKVLTITQTSKRWYNWFAGSVHEMNNSILFV